MLENLTYTPNENGQVILSKSDYENLLSKYAESQAKTEYLQHELDKLRRMLFGVKSERFVPVSADQLSLFQVKEQPAPEPQTETITYEREKPGKNVPAGHGRAPLPAHLPRVDHVIEPVEAVVEGAKKIGEEITEILEYVPGKLFVNRYIRPKYKLPEDKGIVIGHLPSLPIPRGNVGPGLLAHITVSKFVDHVPFYRQMQQFKREGIHLPESTLGGWFAGGCSLLESLYERHKELVQKANYKMADETPIPVLTQDKPGATHKGYFWAYCAPLERLVLFDYRKGRGREGPLEILKDFRGTLQTDGYEVYKIFEQNPDIVLLACMAHARRKFNDAKDNDKKRAEYALGMIQKLYKTEQYAREMCLSHDERKALRQEQSVPVLEQIETWLHEEFIRVLPKSAIGQAIAYSISLWPRLKRYVDDGRYEIDNNLIENTIRPVALGRKNYLFAGSHNAAQRTAMIYSFLGTCKLHDKNPFLWLRDVLTNLPDCKISDLDIWLPQNYSPQE